MTVPPPIILPHDLTAAPPATLPATMPATLPATLPVSDVPPPTSGGPVPDAVPDVLLAPITGQPIQQAREAVRTFFDLELWSIIGQRALLIGGVVLVTLLILRVGRGLLDRLQRARHLPDTVMLPIRRGLRALIVVLALILALQFAGFSMLTILTGLGALLALIGVAFIAVWSILSNVACSLFLMIFKPFRIGDYVELVESAAGPNVGGRVTDVTMMYVVLREETDEGPAFVQVPNNLFFQKTIRRRAGRRAVPIEQHVEKHGLTGREQPPPKG